MTARRGPVGRGADEAERTARALADEFAAHDGTEIGLLRAATAASIVRTAQMRAVTVPPGVVDRMLHALLSAGAEQEARLTEKALRGEDIAKEVERAVAVIDEIHEQDNAELEGIALAAWRDAIRDLKDLND